MRLPTLHEAFYSEPTTNIEGFLDDLNLDAPNKGNNLDQLEILFANCKKAQEVWSLITYLFSIFN